MDKRCNILFWRKKRGKGGKGKGERGRGEGEKHGEVGKR